MRFTRKIDDISKHVKSTNSLEHYVRCYECQSRQDFDRMPLPEAKKAALEAGWREGITEDKEKVPVCPECVEELEVVEQRKHDLEWNSYD